MQGQLQGRLNPTLDSTSHSNNSLLPLQRDGRCRPHSPTCYPFKWFLLFMKTQGTGNLTFSVQFCQLNHFNRNHLSVIFLHNVFVPQKNSLVFTHARPAGGAEAQNEKEEEEGGALGHSIRRTLSQTQPMKLRSPNILSASYHMSRVHRDLFVWKLCIEHIHKLPPHLQLLHCFPADIMHQDV